ncbi:carbon-nitrogen hydrolase family protein [Paenarthrobacter nicotinovorans]|uniref:carbon-nitrogen hydrolase family protein n=1 Tax=Paenarthrobacter nicotinovorans TaxID=29320 RepID=UPI0037F2ED7B
MTINYNIKTRVAAVQSEPVWFDGDATVEKACDIIAEAAENGAKIIGFPEVYISGFPWWVFTENPVSAGQFVKDYYASSMSLRSERMKRIMAAARRNKIFVVMGYSELDGASLYMSQAFIGDDGRILANRRKLKPTHAERSLFGEGDGSDLFVVDTPVGRIGGLSCWEHYQALEIFAMSTMHEQVHVASWPSHDCYQNNGYNYSVTIDANRNATAMYAQLTQSFVIAATSLIGPAAHKAFRLNAEQQAMLPHGGGWAAIFSPEGEEVTRDRRIPSDQEGIVYADVDFTDILAAKSWRDPVGHYSRPDIFTLHINTNKNSLVEYNENKSERDTGDLLSDFNAQTLAHFEGSESDVRGETALTAPLVRPNS